PRTPYAQQRNPLATRQRIRHGQFHPVADALALQQHRQALRTEPLAVAGRARLLDHEFFELLAHAVGGGFAVATLDVLQDAVPARFILPMPALAVVLERQRLSRRARQDDLLRLRRQLLPRGVEVELERT